MVSPKIEDLSIGPPNGSPSKTSFPRRNPFQPAKKSTYRRKPHEIAHDRVVPATTGARRGLNTPQLLNPTPLDAEFSMWDSILEGPLDELTIDVLSKKIESFDMDTNLSFDTRLLVITHILEGLEKVQLLSNNVKHSDVNLLKISLHDIKIFSKMINAVVVLGIYPALDPFGIGVSLNKRQLNSTQGLVGDDSYLKRISIADSERLLTTIYEKLFLIMSVKSDVADLLSRGTGFSDLITVAVALITVPHFDGDRKNQIEASFDSSLCTIADTYELYQTFNLLLMSTSPQYFKNYIMSKLQLLPCKAPRGDGLLTLIEFVLGLRDHEDINVEKFEQVASVVLLKPRQISTVEYFISIGAQMYDLLININKPAVTSCVGFTLEKLWEKNQSVTRDFFIKKVWDGINPTSDMVSEASFNNNINVLISLTNKGLDQSLMKAMIDPILLPLWAYFKFVLRGGKPAEIVLGILVAYFSVLDETAATKTANFLAENLMCNGGNSWMFATGINGLTEIIPRNILPDSASTKTAKMGSFVKELDEACLAMTKLLSDLDDSLIRTVFVGALNRWLSVNERPLISESESLFIILGDLKLLECVGESFNEILAESPKDILVIVENLLSKKVENEPLPSTEPVDSDDEDESDEFFYSQTVSVVLKLLSTVLCEPSVWLDEESRGMLKSIKAHLVILKVENSFSSTAATSLAERIEELLSGDLPARNNSDIEQRVFKKAVTSLGDPLVPIRAHGLYLLRQLIEAKSDVLSVDFVFELHMVQIKDPDPFVYLNVIKGLDSLTAMDPEGVLTKLVEIYANAGESSDLDDRLRVGEILLRFINRQNKLFSGLSAGLVVRATLSVLRRSLDSSKQEEIQLRMSSMSLLGVCCRVNPLGFVDHIEDALECAIGVLQLETSHDEAVMRRAAVVLIHDLILGTSDTSAVIFPAEYRPKVISVLKYSQEFDSDPLVREQCSMVLSTVDDLVKAAIEAHDGFVH